MNCRIQLYLLLLLVSISSFLQFAQATPYCTVAQTSPNAVNNWQWYTQSSWTVTSGGDGWAFFVDDRNPSSPSSSNAIVASYAWSTITQTIDVATLGLNLNIVASITYRVSYRGTGCCQPSNLQDWGQISIDFLDTAGSSLHSYTTGEFQTPGDETWRQNSITFTSANFNITRLRYAVVTLRGKDNEKWSAQYGIAYNNPELTFFTTTSSTGFVGATCSTPVTCYGLAWNNPAVCGGHGLCQGVDYCICNTGYYGLSCARTFCNGEAMVWGRNSNGQSGNGTVSTAPMRGPQIVPPISGKTLTYVQKSATTVFASTVDNLFYSWGANSLGQLGTGALSASVTTPASVVQGGVLSGLSLVGHALSDSNQLFIMSNGRAYTVGSNQFGNLGDGTTVTPKSSPVAVAQTGNFAGKTVLTGCVSSMVTVLVTDEPTSNVYVAGANFNGNLGTNNANLNAQSSSPIQVHTAGALNAKMVTRVVCMANSVLAMTTDRILVTWGANNAGQLGDGTSVAFQIAPVQVDLTGVVGNILQIVAGDNHVLFYTSSNFLYGFGANSFGQLGLGDTAIRNTPVRINTGSIVGRIISGIAAFGNSSFVWTNDGSISFFGQNTNFEGGLGTNAVSSVLTPIAMDLAPVAGKSIFSVIPGGALLGSNCFTCFGKYGNDPTVCSGQGRCAGNNFCSCNAGYQGAQCQTFITCNGVASTLSNVCSGNGNCVWVDKCACYPGFYGQFCNNTACSTTMYAWGRNTDGQIGNGGTASRNTYTSIGFSASPNTFVYYAKDIDVTVAMTQNNVLYSWGRNALGQLGVGDFAARVSPSVTNTSTFGGRRLAAHGLGKQHQVFVTDDGRVHTVGFNQRGQLGDGTLTSKSTPATISTNGALIGRFAIGACAGLEHTLIITNNFTHNMIGQGLNTYGQLGEGTLTNYTTPTQILYSGAMVNKKIIKIACHYYGSIGITNDGDLVGQGHNLFGSLGDGTFTGYYTSVKLSGFNGTSGATLVDIAAGAYHSLALLSTGVVYSFGHNQFGQLGLGDITNRNVPTLIPTLTGITQISANEYSSFALKNNGLVFAFGRNGEGQLGDNTFTDRFSPVQIYSVSLPSIYAITNYGAIRANNCPMCNFVVANNPSVCSSKGSCTSNNVCACNSGWTGTWCELTTCGGILSSNPSVCSSRGNCTGPNTCVCPTNYGGTTCQTPFCYGTLGNGGCNLQGTCSSPNNCVCLSTYTGIQCQFPICHGIPSNNTSVCLGRGGCNFPDACYCNATHGGLNCNIFICNGFLADKSYVCSGRGSCVAPNTCNCNSGYGNTNCQDIFCYGVSSSSGSACSGHGTCSSPDACSCISTYTGNQCQFPICYTIASNNPSVCSNRQGNCTAPNTCSCNTGYTGTQCQTPVCFGIAATSAFACTNGQGTCTGPDTCACTAAWSGPQCNVPVCYGTPGSNPAVCGGHGTCNSPDNCGCNTGYSGTTCSQYSCYGTPFGSGSVCSARGTCTAPDSCSCPSGWVGLQCETPQCFGITAGATACSNGQGTCTFKDTCTCNAGYTGTQCQTPICNGIASNISTVCSGHGTCIGPNSCNCTSGYTGTNCEVPICFGTASNSAMVCSGHGNCVSPNLCACNANYFGTTCSTPSCFNILANSTLVCSRQNGTCTGVNTCVCNTGYTNSQCQTAICFGINGDQPSVCSGHGNCIAPNTCSCSSNYVGNNCQFPTCFGISANSTLVCSGNGTCTAPNNCSCLTGFTAGSCARPVCFGRNASDTSVCSGRGICNGPDKCICQAPYQGNNCQFFNCFGVASNTNNTAQLCSGHGTCIDVDTCLCSANYFGNRCTQTFCGGIASNSSLVCNNLNGTCVGFNNCSCNANYMGSTCNISICYGIPATNASSVCSGHGTCTRADTCACAANYTGNQCQTPICFNIVANTTNVCTGHGTCVAADTCTCAAGYYNAQCSNFNCFNIPFANTSTVCSNHGSCITPNNCSCQLGYGGADCSLPTCFGIVSNNSLVCSGRNGTCYAPDSCNCTTGYTGNQCQIPICYGISGNNTLLVCSNGNGTCTSRDNCVCNTGYTGAQCQIPICFNVLATDNATACTFGNGTCINKDTCVCNAGYTGSRCEIPICFGQNGTAAAACSGHGSCVRNNVCSCRSGYYSSKCEDFDCYGVYYANNQTCSGHGSCVADNACICSAGYTGNNCSVPICFGFLANSSQVCSLNNGTCTQPDTCVCSSGYTGTRCEIPICHGIAATSSSVCSNSNGTCIAHDTCKCNAGYTGTRCEIPICFNVMASASTSVCTFGNGTCINRDTCICNSNYTGSNCEIPICHGYAATHPSTCTGHGTCVANNLCSCQPGFYSNRCELFNCNGIPFTNPATCSNNGNCVLPDQCVCNNGYTGNNCQVPICYGLLANNSRACSNQNGTCVARDTCVCNSGYFGNQCQVPFCYGIAANSSQVCTFGNGTCLSRDNCKCNVNYHGNQCEIPICYGTSASNPNACSTNGTCVKADTCSCNIGFFGSQCENWNCNGVNSKLSTTCSGHGTCLSPNLCQCAPGYTGNNCQIPICYNIDASNPAVCSFGNGTCVAPDTCICSSGYYGNQCQVPFCYGIAANDTRICTQGNGTCVKKDTCVCNTDYVDEQCQTPVCFGVAATSASTTCSGKGSCVKANSCVCQPGYYGNNCQFHDCYLFRFSNTSVCSGHGACLTPDFCNCNPGWVGLRCDVPVCYGILGNDTRVCTFNNGTCTAPDTCECNKDYIGNQCQVPVCYGIAANSSSVCTFGNGTCIKANTCACNVNYVSAQCEVPVCFGILATNSSVCLTNGTCVREDTCVCKPGFYGNQCQHYDCNGVHYTSPSVCSANGKCDAPNTCICDMARGWEGANCNQIQCYNMLNCSGHGACVSNNTCSCITDWQGQICNIPVCFGINGTNSSVCSNHGSCVSANTCSCFSDYIGTRCETPVCFGRSALDSATCNGKGRCVDANTCICSAGYTGPMCSIITCTGVMFNSSSVCSSRGTCSAPDTCDCSIGFAGASCQEPTCNGIPASSSTACNSRGSCIGPNLCQCRSGYSGLNCETISSNLICFGRASIDSTVCNGHGICLGNNTCNCTAGFAGLNCEDRICHGKRSSDFSVCSGNGVCNTTNTCICSPGYYGTECAFWNCNGFRSDNSSVCNGRGTCTAPNTCACQSGFTGDCTIPICYGRNSSDSSVCSGHGTCSAPNSCSCQANYMGINCEFRRCFGKLNIDTTVCSGRGSCVAPDTCVCAPGFIGSECSVPVCFGIPANQSASQVCGGHGTCSAPNTCVCRADSVNGFWAGSTCGNCSANYIGMSCTQKFCDDATTCNGRGTCDANLQCTCKSSQQDGFWTGPFCDQCVPGYTLGSGCKDFCSSASRCNSRGVCDNNGGCICFNNATVGFFGGQYCTSCADNWFGASCNAFVSPTFNFSARGDSMEGLLIVPLVGNTINCSSIIRADSLARLGTGARCFYPDRVNRPSAFTIQFGQQPTFGRTESIIFSFGSQSRFVPVNVPTFAVRPTAVIQAPETIGFCDGLTLNAMNSFSPDRRTLNCAWRAVSGFKIDVLNSFFNNQSSSSACTLEVPQNLLDSGYTFVFELTVTSFLGATGTASISVTKTNTPMAIASIVGPPIQKTFVSSFLRVEAAVTLSSCFYDNKEVTFSWRQISGQRVNPSSVNGRFLDFAAFTFPAFDDARNYVYEVTVQAVANPAVTSTETVTINVVPQALQARIAGGATLTESKNNTIILDGTASFDPDNVRSVNETFSWVCFTSTSSFCDLPSSINLNQPRVTLPPFTFNADTYTFNLVYSKGQRTASAFRVLTIVNEQLPSVAITTVMPEKLNPATKITIIGLATVVGASESDLIYNWIVTSSNTNFVLRAEDVLTGLDSSTLVIKPNVLQVGETYSFSLSASLDLLTPQQRKLSQTSPSRRRVSGGAGTNSVVANDAPQPGSFDVTPSSGTTVQTLFKFTASQWNDEDTPLTYAFGYYRPDGSVVMLAPSSLSNTISVLLPLGNSTTFDLIVLCRVTDKFGSSTTVTRTVSVRPLSPALQTASSISTTIGSSIASALTSSDSTAVTQITAAALTALAQPVVDASNISCPNSCSGHGTCNTMTGACTCNQGFALSDCSITNEELANRQQLRQDLTNAVVSSLGNTMTSGVPITSDTVAVFASTLVNLASAPAELNSDTKLQLVNSISLLSSLSANSTGALATDAAKSLAATLGSVTSTIFITPSAGNSSAASVQESKQLAAQISEAANTLALAILGDKVPGEQPTIISSPGISIGSAIYSPTGDAPVTFTFGSNGIPAVSLPTNLLSSAFQQARSMKKNRAGGNPPKDTNVGVVAVSYDGNPYSYAASSKNVTSTVFSVGVFDVASSNEIKLTNMSTPLEFTLGGTFTQQPMLQPNDSCIIEPIYVPTCRYWDDLFQEWKTDGCKNVELGPNNIGCKCNKVDSFAALLEFALPEINLLTPSDFLLITQLNVDNMAIAVILGVISVGYFILLIFTTYLDYRNRYWISQEERTFQIEQVFKGRIRYMVEIIKNSHLWGSVFIRPTLDDVFTRPRRLTFAYMILVTVLGLGAMFHQTQQGNIVKSILAGVISSLVSFPPTFIAVQLFVRIAVNPEYKKTLKAAPLHMFELTEFDKNELREEIELARFNSKEIEMREKGIKGEVLLSPTSDEHKPPFDLFKNEYAMEQIDERRRQEERIQRVKRQLGYRKDIFTYIAEGYNLVLNKADNYFDTAEGAGRGLLDKFISGGLTPFAAIVTVLVIMFYFAVIVAVVLVMELVFKQDLGWNSYFSTALVAASIVVLFIGFNYLYFNQKYELWNSTFEWTISKKGIIVSVILSIVFILCAILTLGIASAVQFWRSWPDGVIHTALVTLFFVGLAANTIAFIVLSLKKPKIEMQEIRDLDKYTGPPLPWWCIFWMFPLCWAYIAGWSYALIIYGIKFGPVKQRDWLITAFTGIAKGEFIDNPIDLLWKTILLSLIIYIVQVILVNASMSQSSKSASNINSTMMSMKGTGQRPKMGMGGMKRGGKMKIKLR